MLPFLGEHLYAKNQGFPSRDTDDQKIMYSDWARAFLAITWGPEFSQVPGFHSSQVPSFHRKTKLQAL